MTMDKIWSDKAWADYLSWQTEDRRTLKKINDLIRDIERGNPFGGLGKPELLRHKKAWSRKIDDANRLVYNLNEHRDLCVISCKGHYED